MVFGRLRDHLSSWFANLISSLAFMAHHVLLLGYLMGWTQPLMYVFSLGVAIGGIVWAVLYERSGSLIPAWVSHLLVDAGIMAAGYLMVRPVLG
jgi:membrane protease YdiL (CAAX protease family)